jgi:hypothetical protein
MGIRPSRRQWFGGLLGLFAGWLARSSQANSGPPSVLEPVLPAEQGAPGFTVSRYDALNRLTAQTYDYDGILHTWRVAGASPLNTITVRHSADHKHSREPRSGLLGRENEGST